jgi:hypothetical protein
VEAEKQNSINRYAAGGLTKEWYIALNLSLDAEIQRLRKRKAVHAGYATRLHPFSQEARGLPRGDRFSCFEHAHVVLGGESFVALAEGLRANSSRARKTALNDFC